MAGTAVGKKDVIVGLVIVLILVVSYFQIRENRRAEREEARARCIKESYERAGYYGGTQKENYSMCLEEHSEAGAVSPQ